MKFSFRKNSFTFTAQNIKIAAHKRMSSLLLLHTLIPNKNQDLPALSTATIEDLAK